MKKPPLKLAATVVAVAAGSLGLSAQNLFDSFADGDFTASPAWSGNTSAWTVVTNSDVAVGTAGSNTLRLAATAAASTDYLSSQPASWGDEQEWGFWLGRRAQAYTASNQVYIWLYANESNLTAATVDGYRIAIGDDSGGDEIRLEYIVNGVLSATVISSSASIPNGLTDIGILLRVTRSSTGSWQLFTSTLPAGNGGGELPVTIPNAVNAAVNQGSATHNLIIPASGGFIGIAALHSSGGNAITAVELDQVYLTTTTLPAADVLLSSADPAVGAATITQGSTNNVIYHFQLAVSNADAALTSITITTSGSYAAADLANLKCWYSPDNSFDALSDVLLSTKSTDLDAGPQFFPGFSSQVLGNGTTAHIFITTDLHCGSTNNASVTVSAVTTADLGLGSANKSGSASAGGAQSIGSALPVNATAVTTSASDQSITVGWTAPAGCYDELLIIAAPAANTAAPSGDGSSYSGNLNYGSGTAISNGYVVYKGTNPPQTILSLVNGNNYFFKLFTRNDLLWSNGTETTASPVQPVVAGEILINQFSPDFDAASDEYIELVNTTSRSIDLSVLKIVYQSAAGNSSSAGGILSGIIPANGFWLLSANAVVTIGSASLNRDGAITSGFAASGQLAIQRISDNLQIDGLAYGTITVNNLGEGTAAPATPSNGGLKRNPDGGDSETNNLNFVTVANASIQLRNSSSRYLRTGAVLAAGNYPTVSVFGSASMGGDVTTGTLVFPMESRLAIGANTLTITGAVNGEGTLFGSSSSNLVISGNAGTISFFPGGMLLKNLTLGDNASLTLGTTLEIVAGIAAGELSIGSNATLQSGGFLRLKSDANGNARVASVGVGGTITGNVTVERYIPGRRAWRLITAPLSAGESIFDAWQHSGTYTAGRGMLITGPSADPATNGLDLSSANSASMYRYDQSSNTWVAITNTKTTQVSSSNGYLVFIRGDRNPANLSASTSPNNTTLDATGILRTGDQQFSTNTGAGNFSLLANPYVSPVDFDLLYSDGANGGGAGTTNIQRKFWTWDPNLGDRGGYVTVSHNGLGYDVVPAAGVSSQTQHLQPGQAFFVQSNATGTNQLTFKESHKSASIINTVFRGGNQLEKLVINLGRKTAAGSYRIIDGILASFHNSFSKSINEQDAVKLPGFDEYLALSRDGSLLSIEAAPLPGAGDTSFLFLGNMKPGDYELSIAPSGFSAGEVTAWLIDLQPGTTMRLHLDSSNKIKFTITQSTLAAAYNRFRIVFKSTQPLASSRVRLTGYRHRDHITLQWTYEGDETPPGFEIEKSEDGKLFRKIADINGHGNAALTYRYIDMKISTNNYYRLKWPGPNGEVKRSAVLRLTSEQEKTGIQVSPNPAGRQGFQLSLSQMPEGWYSLHLREATGKFRFTENLFHNGASSSRWVTPSPLPGAGIYIITLVMNGRVYGSRQLIIR